MKIQRDKVQHMFWGLGMVLAFGFVIGATWSVLLATVAMASKEIVWDWLLPIILKRFFGITMKKGSPDLMDFVYGFTGICLGLLILEIL